MKSTPPSSVTWVEIHAYHARIERELQRLGAWVTQGVCDDCDKVCCQPEICHESVESDFLSALHGEQSAEYSRTEGWLTPQGCKLRQGRPLLCYDFYCQRFRGDPRVPMIQKWVAQWRAAYATGSLHQNVMRTHRPHKVTPYRVQKTEQLLQQLWAELAKFEF